MKERNCKNCKGKFQQERPLQYLCNNGKCVYEYAEKKLKEKRDKADKELKKELREKTKKLSDYESEAKKSFQHYIRLRDKDQPCISCGNNNPSDWCGSHYYAAGIYSGLMFNEMNCNGACNTYCNKYLSGNPHEYRKGLINKYGEEALLELDKKANETRNYKFTKQELIAKKLQYDLKIKEMKKKP